MINRRDFLRNSVIFTAGAIVPFKNYAEIRKTCIPAPGSLKIPELITVTGRIHSNGNPISDVVVSDGISCVAADRYGEYKILTDNRYNAIFISVPRAYKIPVNKYYVPEFYSPVDPQHDKISIDFELFPDKDDTEHSFLLLADPQVLDDDDLRRFSGETIPDINNFIQEHELWNTFAVGCGDIVFDRLDLFDEYIGYMSRLRIPFFSVLGNHDVDVDSYTDENSSLTYRKNFGPPNYSFNRGEIHYVVLDDVFWYGEGYLGYLSKGQLDWLAMDLSFVKKGSTIVLFMHIPPYNTLHVRSQEKEPGNSVIVVNRKALYEVLKNYKSYIITGHMHESEFIKEGDTEIHVCGAVCGAWWSADMCGDGTPNGYMVYNVRGKDITWQYKSTGKPFDYQMRIFDERDTEKRRILVNVWGANDEWKIYTYSGNRQLGQMQMVLERDPQAIVIFDGPDKPRKHRWVESYPTYHMYEFKVDKSVGGITVKAYSDQGKIFTGTL